MNSRILVNGAPFFMYGANYPWMVNNGKSNYGLDFGLNEWEIHHGVSTNLEQVAKDFATMRTLGFNTLRWFVFTDGRGGIRFDAKDMPAEPAEKFYDDMDAVLTIAAAHDIKLIFVLLDYLWMHDVPPSDSPNKKNYAHVLKSNAGQDELIGRVFHPLFHRYATHPNVLAWEVMNEPDWVVDGLNVNRKNVRSPISFAMFKSFVRKIANAVHYYTASKVTVGGGRVKFLHVWDDDEMQLDFLQAHTYNDFLNHPWDGRLFGTTFEETTLKRPLLIGEFSTNAHRAFDDNRDAIEIPLSAYLDFSLKSNFAGCLYWSYNNVDKCGTEDMIALQEWSMRNSIA